MSKAELTCFRCGDKGHVQSECPNEGIDASGKPPWCGICDEITRQIETGAGPARCQECHPLRRQLRRPLRRCPSCHVTVYEWDHQKCGSHAGPDIPDKRPEREHIDAIVGAK